MHFDLVESKMKHYHAEWRITLFSISFHLSTYSFPFLSFVTALLSLLIYSVHHPVWLLSPFQWNANSL